MQRTKKAANKNEIKWKNYGGAFYTKSRQRIPYLETFSAAPEDIPEAFRSTIKPLDAEDLARIEFGEEPEAVIPSYTMKKREGTDYYDVYDARDKKISERDLLEFEAMEIIDQLMAE